MTTAPVYASSRGPGSEAAERSRFGRWLVRAALVAFALAAANFGAWRDVTPARSTTLAMMMMVPQAAMLIEDRQVCRLAGDTDAGILGQDGGLALAIDGTSYWIFGDTLINANPWMIPNNIATSTDFDGRDCVTLTHKANGGIAAPLLPVSGVPEELTVWPLTMANAVPGYVHFFYLSVAPAPPPFSPTFIGLARFDPATLTAERLGPDPILGTSFWDETYGIHGLSALVDGGYVYLFFSTGDVWHTSVGLARVPRDQIEDAGAYAFWHAGTQQFTNSFADATALFVDVLALPPSQVEWNPFLSKWTMLYYSLGVQGVTLRTADALTGPWSPPKTVIDCRAFYGGPGPIGTYCYSASQHAELQRDGGSTIYVTLANELDYHLFLHELTLAEPIQQVLDASGQRLYLPSSAEVPATAEVEGVAFYAARNGDDLLAAVHRWSAGGEVIYAPASEPPAGFNDDGVAFYAPLRADMTITPLSPGVASTTVAAYEPVYRWDAAGTEGAPASHVYSQFAAVPGYTRGPIAFYAPCPDSDSDGASDCLESSLGTERTNPDTDGDKCMDGREPALGLDPMDPWDFFSVPIPALLGARDPRTATSDSTVSAVDSQAVFIYFRAGAVEGSRVYDQDLDQNGVPDGRQYDRSVAAPGESGPPDGVVTAGDAQLTVAQRNRGLKCR